MIYLQELRNSKEQVEFIGSSEHRESREQMRNMRFYDYYLWWIKTYKANRISKVTLRKYYGEAKHLWKLVPDMRLKDYERSRESIQDLLDMFGKAHRHLTCLEFKNHVLAALRMAVEDDFIDKIADSQLVVTSMEDNWSIEKRNKVLNKPKTMTASEFRLFKTRIEIDLTDILSKPAIRHRSPKEAFSKNPEAKPVSEQTKLMVLNILFHTGCRFAEALGLTFGDIDFENRSIKIDKTWDYKSGTGFVPTKNKSSNRVVAVDDSLLDLIKKYKEWKHEQFGDVDLPMTIEPDTNTYNDTYNNFFRRYEKRYGIKEDLSIHKIRHSYISFLLSEGIAPETIAPQVGHSDTTMITQVYGHLLKEQRDIDNLRIASLMR